MILSAERYAYGLVATVFFTLILQSTSQMFASDKEKKWKPKQCAGVPIMVNYPYEGGFLEPHACAPQCLDGRQRYVVYKNGFATQCEAPPGCRDLGEDRGVTCVISK